MRFGGAPVNVSNLFLLSFNCPVGVVVASATDEGGVLGSIPRSGKKMGFSIRKFLVVAWSLEAGGVTSTWLGKHVKLLT